MAPQKREGCSSSPSSSNSLSQSSICPTAAAAAAAHHPVREGSSFSPGSSSSRSLFQMSSCQAAGAATSSSLAAAAAPLPSLLAALSTTQLAYPARANLAPLAVTPPLPATPTGPATPTSPSMPPPFLMKTYELVDDASTDDVISWSNEGRSFVVWSPDDLCQRLLLRFFKHSNFSSFVRQLNTYGFRKISLERWEFANDDFQRGRKHLLGRIQRRRSSGVARPSAPLALMEDHTHAMTMLSSSSIADTAKSGAGDEIERIRKDKSMLMNEVARLQRLLDSTMEDLHTMWERLQEAEACQEHMIVFVYKAFNHPGFLAQFKQQHLASTKTDSQNSQPTLRGAVEYFYDTARAGGLLSSSDIVSPHGKQHVSVQGATEAEPSKPNWDEVRLVDFPSKTLDELLEDAKLESSASISKKAYTPTAAQGRQLLLCTQPQFSRSSSAFLGDAALCSRCDPASSDAYKDLLILPYSPHNSRTSVSPLKLPSDQHSVQTASSANIAEQVCEHGVNDISSWRSSMPTSNIQADALRGIWMPRVPGAAGYHRFDRSEAADGHALRQHDRYLPTVADRYGHFNVPDTFSTYGAASIDDRVYNVNVKPSGSLENPLAGAPGMMTASQQQEEGFAVRHEEGSSASDTS